MKSRSTPRRLPAGWPDVAPDTGPLAGSSVPSAGLSILLPVCALVCLLAGCAGTGGRTDVDDLLARNRENLGRLTIGMSKAQLLEIMGDDRAVTVEGAIVTNPYRREVAMAPDGTFLDVLFYCTDRQRSDRNIADDELTPIVLGDGHVIGWGWSFLERRAPPAALHVSERP